MSSKNIPKYSEIATNIEQQAFYKNIITFDEINPFKFDELFIYDIIEKELILSHEYMMIPKEFLTSKVEQKAFYKGLINFDKINFSNLDEKFICDIIRKKLISPEEYKLIPKELLTNVIEEEAFSKKIIKIYDIDKNNIDEKFICNLIKNKELTHDDYIKLNKSILTSKIQQDAFYNKIISFSEINYSGMDIIFIHDIIHDKLISPEEYKIIPHEFLKIKIQQKALLNDIAKINDVDKFCIDDIFIDSIVNKIPSTKFNHNEKSFLINLLNEIIRKIVNESANIENKDRQEQIHITNENDLGEIFDIHKNLYTTNKYITQSKVNPFFDNIFGQDAKNYFDKFNRVTIDFMINIIRNNKKILSSATKLILTKDDFMSYEDFEEPEDCRSYKFIVSNDVVSKSELSNYICCKKYKQIKDLCILALDKKLGEKRRIQYALIDNISGTYLNGRICRYINDNTNVHISICCAVIDDFSRVYYSCSKHINNINNKKKFDVSFTVNFYKDLRTTNKEKNKPIRISNIRHTGSINKNTITTLLSMNDWFRNEFYINDKYGADGNLLILNCTNNTDKLDIRF
jgi:hypothetical protein